MERFHLGSVEEKDFQAAVNTAWSAALFLPSVEAFRSTLAIVKECSNMQYVEQAFSILMGWLNRYPPVTSALRNLYEAALGLGDWESIRMIMENAVKCAEDASNLGHTGDHRPVYVLRLVVAALERNFLYLAHHPGKKCNFLVIRCLWAPSYSIYHNNRIQQLLQFFESALKTMKTPQACYEELLSMISMATQCCHLEDNGWKWVTNGRVERSSVAIAHELANVLKESQQDVLGLLSPPWLVQQVCATLLDDYDNYLVPGGLTQGSITLKKIVSEYFFLLPKLSAQIGSESPSSRKPKERKPEDKNPAAPLKKAMLTFAKVNQKNKKGETILHKAAMKNDVRLLKEVLSIAGVDINVQDYAGWTPTHEACNRGHIEIVKELLKFVPSSTLDNFFQSGIRKKRVDLNLFSFEGITPLHDAVLINHISIVKLLLKHGGCGLLEAKTCRGFTAMDLAATEEMRQVLSSENPDINLSQDSLQEPLGSHRESVPTSFMYTQVVDNDSGHKLQATDEEARKFLRLLTLIIKAHLQVMGQKAHSDSDIKDFDVTFYYRCLRRHMKKITSEDVFEKLFQLVVLETLLTYCCQF